MRFNKSLSNNNENDNHSDDDNKNRASETISCSPYSLSQPYAEQTYTSTNPENSLVHIDTVKVDEKSRLVLTKKAKGILHIQPKDVVVIYHDRVNNHTILKVQRGANNSIADIWVLKRNVVVGYKDDYKNEGIGNNSSSGSSIHQHNTQQEEEQEYRKPINIMLIDDEPDVLLSLKTVISSQGHNVEAFGDSQEALKRFLQVINTNKDSNAPYYKLVITDIRMQGLNGVQFYQILKALDKNIKILFISGLDTAEEIISVLPNATLNDIIRKPIEADRLNQIIQRAILSRAFQYDNFKRARLEM